MNAKNFAALTKKNENRSDDRGKGAPLTPLAPPAAGRSHPASPNETTSEAERADNDGMNNFPKNDSAIEGEGRR